MEQNKKENKNKIEKKKESKNNNDYEKSLTKSEDKHITHENPNEVLLNNSSDDENKDTLDTANTNNFSKDDGIENKNINNQDVVKLLTYYESMTGILGGLNIGFLKLAIATHGYNNVKMAMNRALEVNKANMTYINGILKNWRREGYPKDNVEVKKDGTRCIGKSNETDKNEFAGFKPKEPRKLTEAERKRAEANLI